MDVTVRHGRNGVAFLALANRGSATFDGPVTYLDVGGTERRVQLRAGGPHVSFALFRDGQLESALLHGEDGAYVASSGGGVEIDRGQVVVARCGTAILVSAPESVRVTLRLTEGWEGLRAWRLLLEGGVVPATVRVDAETLVLEYRAELGARDTEAYLLAPAEAAIAAELRPLLVTRLLQRALYLGHPYLQELAEDIAARGMREMAAEIAQAVDALGRAAEALRAAAAGPLSIETYVAALASAAGALAASGEVLVDALRRLRAGQASGEPSATERESERDLTRALNLLARAELRPE